MDMIRIEEITGWGRHLRSLLLPAIAVTVLLLATSVAQAEDSAWKVGRGFISGHGGGSGLTLKLSLRNTTSPSPDQVRIMGRWSGEGPGKRSISTEELRTFVELGLFAREVRMKQTVIVEMVLAPLGPRPGNWKNVEVAVITGNTVTDGVVIAADF